MGQQQQEQQMAKTRSNNNNNNKNLSTLAILIGSREEGSGRRLRNAEYRIDFLIYHICHIYNIYVYIYIYLIRNRGRYQKGGTPPPAARGCPQLAVHLQGPNKIARYNCNCCLRYLCVCGNYPMDELKSSLYCTSLFLPIQVII